LLSQKCGHNKSRNCDFRSVFLDTYPQMVMSPKPATVFGNAPGIQTKQTKKSEKKMNPHYNIKQTVNRSRLARLVLSTIAGIVFTLSAQAVVPLTYMWQNISSDIHGVAPFFNPYLVNPWGIAGWPGGEDTFVTADNGSGVVTIHNPLGDAVIATTGTAVFTSGSAATVFEITVPVPVSGTSRIFGKHGFHCQQRQRRAIGAE
jgi:hypothetical protein